MTYRRLILVTAAAAAIALCAIPATASANICAESTWCTYNLTEWFGAQYNFSYVHTSEDGLYPANAWEFVREGRNDVITSYENNRVHRTWVGKNWPNDSQVRCIRPHGESSNLGAHRWPNGTSADNSISSLKLETESEADCAFE